MIAKSEIVVAKLHEAATHLFQVERELERQSEALYRIRVATALEAVEGLIEDMISEQETEEG